MNVTGAIAKGARLRLSRRVVVAGAPLAAGVALLRGASARKAASGLTERRLAELGIMLPEPAAPIATYAPYRIVGRLVFIAGQGPSADGDAPVRGKVGRELTVEEGAYAARLTAINVLAQAKAACRGDLDRIVQWVRLTGYVNCADDFHQQPSVLDGASNLIHEIFGEKGLHARAAIGVNALPFNVAVEIEATFEIRT